MRNGADEGCAQLTDTTAHDASDPASSVPGGPKARCRSAASCSRAATGSSP